MRHALCLLRRPAYVGRNEATPLRRYAHFVADIPNPTGLKLTEKDGNFYFLLEHNCKELPLQYKKVYEFAGALTDEMCEEVMKKAEEYAKKHSEVGWTTERHDQYPTTDLPLDIVFGPGSVVHGHIDRYILPKIASLFDLDEDNLQIAEIFIVKYQFTAVDINDEGSGYHNDDAEKRSDIDQNTYGSGDSRSQTQTGLAFHVDGCPWSFVVSLNQPDEYTSGGTYFPLIDELLRPSERGTAVLFSGKNYHGGIPISAGSRYIMTGFIHYYDKRNFTHEYFMKDYNSTRDGFGANCTLHEVGFLERELSSGSADSPLVRVFSSCSESNSDEIRGVRSGDILRGIVVTAPKSASLKRWKDCSFRDNNLGDFSVGRSTSFYELAIDPEGMQDSPSLRAWLVKTINSRASSSLVKDLLMEGLKNQTESFVERTRQFGSSIAEEDSQLQLIRNTVLNECRFKLLLERVENTECETYQHVVRNRHHLLATENYIDLDDLLKDIEVFVKQSTLELTAP